jgi:hypothetical protein
MTAPEEPATASTSARALWLLLCVCALVPLGVTRLPPLHDYYHWLFLGKVVSVKLFGMSGRPALDTAYSLAAEPIPNLAAPLGIGLADVFLPLLDAGRLFLAACVLGVGGAYGFLVRTVQRRPTALELMGFPWAYGYFLYNGYLSYLFAVALALYGIAVLYRLSRPEDPRPGRRQLAGVAALGVAVYLSHLIGWSMLGVATLIFALGLPRQAWRRRLGLLLTLLPATALFAWYVLRRHGGELVRYDSFYDKALALVQGLQLYLRTDPFPSSLLPVCWANLGMLVLLAAVYLANLDRKAARSVSRPILVLAAALAVIALAIPWQVVGGMYNPDERILLPALLLAAAALPIMGLTPRRGLVAVGVVAAGLAVHALQFDRAGRELWRINAATGRAIPAGSRVLSISLFHNDLRSTCNPEPGFTIGDEVLRWFGVVRMLESGGTRLNLMETSFVRKEFSGTTPHDLWAMSLRAPEVAGMLRASPGLSRSYPIVELLGCDAEIRAAAAGLGPDYVPVTSGPWFAVLRARRYPRGQRPKLPTGPSTPLVPTSTTR